MLEKALLFLGLASSPALADENAHDLLATADECKTEIPGGKTCVDDLRGFIRDFDGLSYITQNVPRGSGIVFHHNGGLDRVFDSEDSDGRVSADDFTIPIAWKNRPWQTPICSVDDNEKIDLSVRRGEVSEEWGNRFKSSESSDGTGFFCNDAAVPVIVVRRMFEEHFQPIDINGDGFVDTADDTNGDNMVTAEDLRVE